MTNPVTTILMSKGSSSPRTRAASPSTTAPTATRAARAPACWSSAAGRRPAGRRPHPRGGARHRREPGRPDPGITVPSADAQRAVIRRACASGDVDPASVGYYEAHGTGTAVGDPIEATAIGSVLGDSDRTHWIGSVKSNFGHTEAAAGAASLIKAVLCLEHGAIPPNLHFERPNPKIPFDSLPLRVPTDTVDFPSGTGRAVPGSTPSGSAAPTRTPSSKRPRRPARDTRDERNGRRRTEVAGAVGP
ncbi:polyketide synthase [Streptomyces sp. M19]